MTLPWKRDEDHTFFPHALGRRSAYSLPRGVRVTKKTLTHAFMNCFSGEKCPVKKWCFCGTWQMDQKSDLTIFPRYNWYSKSSLTKESCTFDHHMLHVFFQVFQCTFLYWEACHKCHVLQGKNDQKSWFGDGLKNLSFLCDTSMETWWGPHLYLQVVIFVSTSSHWAGGQLFASDRAFKCHASRARSG